MIGTESNSGHALQERWNMLMPEGQVTFLLLLLGIEIPLILATIQQATFNAIVLFVLVSVVGLLLCRNTQIRLKDPSLKVLGYFWLIKIGLTMILLVVGWIPQLDQAYSNFWGYDPQRYYIQAQELIANNWVPDFISLNYVGILYYYAVINYIFGYNPAIPAFINSFMTLLASLFLVRVGYEIKDQRSSRDWTLAFALLIPEILWFDVMTSRETILAVLLLVTMLTIGRYLAKISKGSLFNVLIIYGLSALAIAGIRTSMLLSLCASIALMVILIKPRFGKQFAQRTILLIIALGPILIVGSAIASFLGGYEFKISNLIRGILYAKENIALSSNVEWSEHSIGMLLMPEGFLQSIIFLPPRMILYLVAPLPNIYISLHELYMGSWAAWQKLFTLLSSVINVFLIPFALASLIQSLRTRKTSTTPLIFHIPYWVTFVAISGGNLIIHERYRVMASLLLWGCAWLGIRTSPRGIIVKLAIAWCGILLSGAIFYIWFKFNLL